MLTDTQETANRVAETDDVEKKANFEHALLEEDSPYFEVRATVRNYDQEMPANTIRAWIIGLTATTIVSAVNLLFSLRNPSISIYVYVVQLLAYPVGCGMARVSHCIPSRSEDSVSHKYPLQKGPTKPRVQYVRLEMEPQPRPFQHERTCRHSHDVVGIHPGRCRICHRRPPSSTSLL